MEYIQRFNHDALEVPSGTSEILVSTFSQGLAEGDIFQLLVKKSPANYDDLLRRAEKYINVEEAQKARKTNPNLAGVGMSWPEERASHPTLRM